MLAIDERTDDAREREEHEFSTEASGDSEEASGDTEEASVAVDAPSSICSDLVVADGSTTIDLGSSEREVAMGRGESTEDPNDEENMREGMNREH